MGSHHASRHRLSGVSDVRTDESYGKVVSSGEAGFFSLEFSCSGRARNCSSNAKSDPQCLSFRRSYSGTS